MHPEDKGRKVLRKAGTLSRHCTASQPTRPRSESSSPQKHRMWYSLKVLENRTGCQGEYVDLRERELRNEELHNV